jgi:hypothetical protein
VITYARRVDRNHAEVRTALRAAGWHVTDLFRVGRGVPDMLAARPGLAVLVEVKVKGEKLTEAEEAYLKLYPGPAVVVYGAQDAVDRLAELARIGVTL